MTRFMMTLMMLWCSPYAFNNGMPGDILYKSTSLLLVILLFKEIYNADNEIKIIGVRHGEKIYETLINREEMAKALDLDSYYRIPADNRNLNYNKFFIEGEIKVTQLDDYTSNNTKQLNRDELKQLLFKLPIIRKDILGEDTNNIYEP